MILLSSFSYANVGSSSVYASETRILDACTYLYVIESEESERTKEKVRGTALICT